MSSAAHAQLRILPQAVYHGSILQTSRTCCFWGAGITPKDRSAKVDALGIASADGIFHSHARANGTRRKAMLRLAAMSDRSASCGSLDGSEATSGLTPGQGRGTNPAASPLGLWAVP